MLEGLQVVELAGSPSGAYCGRMLAAAGATVVRSDPRAEADAGAGLGRLIDDADAVIRPAWCKLPATPAAEVVGHAHERRREPGLAGPWSDSAPWRSAVHGAGMAVTILARLLDSSASSLTALERLLADGAAVPQPGPEGPPRQPRDKRLMRARDGWLVTGPSVLDERTLAAVLRAQSAAGEGGVGATVPEWARGRSRQTAAEALQRMRTHFTPVLDLESGARFRQAEAGGAAAGAAGGSGRPELKGRALTGTTIVDFTHLWAGPLCSQLLRALGAEVIKLEGPRRADRLRLWDPADRCSPSFATLNDGKRAIALDLGRPPGAGVFRRILGRIDGMVDNYSPRAWRNWGLDPARLAGQHGVRWVSLPGFSAGGPFAMWGSRGAGLEGTSGLADIHGGDGPPALLDKPMTDAMAGLHGAFAYLCKAWRGGDGHVEVPQNAVAATVAALVDNARRDRTVALSPRLPDFPAVSVGRPPGLGENSAEVLGELRFSKREVRRLCDSGTLLQPTHRLAG